MVALIPGLVFEIGDGGGEPVVGEHVGVAEQAKAELEVEPLREGFSFEDAGADELAGNPGQHFILAYGQDVDAGNLGLLVELLGTELDGLARLLFLGFLEGRFQEHLPQKIGVVKAFGIALEEGQCGQLSLLDMEGLGFPEIEQRADIVGAGRVEDDDPLPLLELADEVVVRWMM